MADLYVALIHFPVLDRRGKIVTAAITSLDIHDLARAAHTYGVRAVFVVHPVAEQRQFAAKVLDHWLLGFGRSFDSRRREALELVRVVADLEEAAAAAQALSGAEPALVFTSARARDGVSFAQMREQLRTPGCSPLMLLFGTGFGLAPAFRDRCDLALEPIRGVGDYNHLSVRSAAAIILDRLRGR